MCEATLATQDEIAWLNDDAFAATRARDLLVPNVANLGLTPRIREWLDGAQHRIVLVSPYFVPGDKGVAYLQQRRAA